MSSRTDKVRAGIFVIVAFLLVVANIDTVLRPVLVPKAAYLNPALLMLSVFGGTSDISHTSPHSYSHTEKNGLEN